MPRTSTPTSFFDTTYEIPDLTGKFALVAGANSGLRLITAREPAEAGASVVIAVRDTGRGRR